MIVAGIDIRKESSTTAVIAVVVKEDRHIIESSKYELYLPSKKFYEMVRQIITRYDKFCDAVLIEDSVYNKTFSPGDFLKNLMKETPQALRR